VRRLLISCWDWLGQHGYHLLFGLTLLSLAALIAWWSLFIRASIEAQYEHAYAELHNTAHIAALSISGDGLEPEPGPLPGSEHLEIARCAETEREVAVPIPEWPGYCVTARPESIAAINERWIGQHRMVIGESAAMVLIIIVSSIMLYRLIYVERRYARQLKEFWSRLTHELKTPITGIKAFLQTLKKRDIPREELLPLVAMALREVERQEMLAENLLMGQRIERESFGLKLREFNLPRRVADFFTEHRILLPAGALSLELSCPAETVVRADPDALWVVMENLLDNALKYGGSDPDIRCTVSCGSGWAYVELSDKGAGFDPSRRERIFDAYHRLTDELPEGRHGTGMGLYLSRKLTRRMGGELSASSPGRGQGATFTIRLKQVR
jgi:signal transduction histidine kinase